MGGRARANKLTPEQRMAISKKAIRALKRKASAASFSTQRRSTKSRRPSSFATDGIERPLDLTKSCSPR